MLVIQKNSSTALREYECIHTQPPFMGGIEPFLGNLWPNMAETFMGEQQALRRISRVFARIFVHVCWQTSLVLML